MRCGPLAGGRWCRHCPAARAARADRCQRGHLASEAISLAFVTALQLLPPRQRAALILCDVLGYRPGEAAGILDTSYAAVAGALKHARATMTRHASESGRDEPPPPSSAAEQELIRKLTAACTTADLDGLVALLTDDVRLTKPPGPFE